MEYLQTVPACLKARIVPVNVNYRYVEKELAYLCLDADLVALVFDAEFEDRVAGALPRAPKLRHLLRVGAPAVEAVPGAVPFAGAEAAGSSGRGFPARSVDDQFIIYTGGTTGMPKGVMWRQEDLFLAGLGGGAPTGEPVRAPQGLARRVAAGGAGITFFPTPPLMHGTSTLTAFIGFHFGQRVLLQRKFVPEEVLRTVERERVTSMSLVGDAMLRPLIDPLGGPPGGTDCSALFGVSSSGAIMSETVRRRFHELLPHAVLLNDFGSSESGYNGTATEDSGPERGFRIRVSPRTRVVDPATHEPVAPGGVGRVAQCSHVPLGYYNDPAKTAETFFEKDGRRWVLLGDMATVDADGVVTVLGRGSQCIDTGAGRCTRRRSSRRSRRIRMCTTHWWPGCRTPGGAAMWRPWSSRARGRRAPRRPTSRATAVAAWPGTRSPAGWSSRTPSSGRRAARRTTGGQGRWRWRRSGRSAGCPASPGPHPVITACAGHPRRPRPQAPPPGRGTRHRSRKASVRPTNRSGSSSQG
ncbi:acyl-CoA synthetase [Streptomyces hygroscopicus subsp. limoneus]|nr:acyl-CoA synthetase [Streptomyces hygroscopicus subsp. limoneus]